MRAISLFSGVGGFDLGFERAGIETVLQVELDPFCRQVLEKHWPDVRRIADVHDVTQEDVLDVELVYGGFPCQPVSVAGKRMAQDDPRWLWPEFARILRMARPRYAVVENVPGLLTAGMGDILRDLHALGYDAEWSIVSACSVGATHTRQRLFIVAYSNSIDGWPRVWDSNAQQEREVSSVSGASSARACWCARLANPSELYRGANGLPHGLDRNRGIGNAVVPQVAELVGRRLMAIAE